MMPAKIMVATDFSSAAALAVSRAAKLARRFGAELRLIHVLPPRRLLSGLFDVHGAWMQQVQGQAAAALKGQADQLAGDTGLQVSTGVLQGRASETMAAAIEQYRPDLLVIGARGENLSKGESTGLGQTASRVMADTACPLLLVRRADIESPQRVLAGLDLGPASKRIAQWAAALSDRPPVIIHAYEVPFAGRLRAYGLKRATINVYAQDQQREYEQALHAILATVNAGPIHPLVVRGAAINVITAQLRKLRIDTLVLGKHTRRKRAAGESYGNTCGHLARFAPADVLVVP